MSQQIDEKTQAELQKFLEAENAKARVHSQIHQFTEMCWDKCITKINNKTDKNDEACLTNCVERFLDTSIFIVRRLEEQRNQMM
ncbi:Tim10/DDP family zinc finger-domain-containing protein [Paraphysoderma sedebokerense]|nr:Tim10/DDP family zinc finger-domain-containing protein [Paraphysoderma sedebokerense]